MRIKTIIAGTCLTLGVSLLVLAYNHYSEPVRAVERPVIKIQLHIHQRPKLAAPKPPQELDV